MYRIEITLKSHNKPSLKSGLKQLQRIVHWSCIQSTSNLLLVTLKGLQPFREKGTRENPLVKTPQPKVWLQKNSLNTSNPVPHGGNPFSPKGAACNLLKGKGKRKGIPSLPFQADPVSSSPPTQKEEGLEGGGKNVRVLSFFTLDSPKLYGKIGLPPLKKVFTVLRSPHIDKKSREQFQWVRYKERISFFCMNKNLTLFLLFIVKYSQFPGIELHLQMKYITFLKKTLSS
jgi:ribosomal protein S10